VPPDADRAVSDVGALADRHSASLYRLALTLTREPATAEELVQETFLRALERGDQLRDPAAAGAWLRRVLHNLAVDRLRRTSRELLVDEVEERWREDAYTVDAAAVVARAETRDELEDALVHLPFDYRAAVLLHDVEGWTVREIAQAAGVGLAAAKQRLRRGRMLLVTRLAEGAERREALASVPLTCWHAREQVSDYLDGDVDPETAALLERHLATCPTCPPLYAALVGVRTELGKLRDPNSVVPPRLVRRLAQRPLR
jgi:RNA polymerase sigma-70 factor, ECF subfamily